MGEFDRRQVSLALAASPTAVLSAKAIRTGDNYVLPRLPVTPPVLAPAAPDSITMADPESVTVRQLTFPIARGPFAADWASIDGGYPKGGEAWLRQAKFGIWVHFGPQASGRSGDWYARRLYEQDGPNARYYSNHLADFGHPSVSGYKEVLRNWNPTAYQPRDLAERFAAAGARFVLVQGVHHDNFDNWNSRYQPWNSVRVGPRRDLVGEWATAAKDHNLRFGITFHHDYSWWWYQTAFGSDTHGPLAGVPYDAHQTLADGVGKWWSGLDPSRLYTTDLREYRGIVNGPRAHGVFQRHQPYAEWYATQWALRIIDAIEQHDPDLIYTDGNSTQPFTGHKTGVGARFDAMERVVAHFFNRRLQRHARLDALAVIKFHPPVRGLATTQESGVKGDIKTDQPWFGEAPLGEWFWQPGIVYDARAIVRYVIENASRDGATAICAPNRSDGSIEEACWAALAEVGGWLSVNGGGIYGSTAWRVLGEGVMVDGALRVLPRGGLGRAQAEFPFGPEDLRYTCGEDGAIYAWTLMIPVAGSVLVLRSLGRGAGHVLGVVRDVSLVGHGDPIRWDWRADGLHITVPERHGARIAMGFRIDTGAGPT